MKQACFFLFILLSLQISVFAQVPMNWTRDEINPGEDFLLSPDDQIRTEGSRSVHMTLKTDAVPYLVSDVYYITPGSDYSFSIDVFDQDTSGRVKVYADFYDTYGFDIFGLPPVFSTDSSQWQTIGWSGTVPAQAVVGYIMVKFYCQPDPYHFQQEAHIRIDNAQFTQTGGINLVANGGFETWNVGISEPGDEPQLSIYPNPAKEYVMIELPQNAVKVILTDMTGRVIFSEKNDLSGKMEIGLGNRPPGLYLVTVYMENNTFICGKFSRL